MADHNRDEARKMLGIVPQIRASPAPTAPILPEQLSAMADRLPTRAESPRATHGAVSRVLFNAALLTFASLLVISLAAGRPGASLLWAGALLVFLAPALDRLANDRTIGIEAITRHADRLRWAGLALAAAGAAVLVL